MEPSESTNAQHVYRLSILTGDFGQVLARVMGTEIALPRIKVAAWGRAAREIQRAARDVWNLTILLLDFLPASDGLLDFAIAKLLSPGIPDGWTVAALDAVSASETTEAERNVLRGISTGGGAVSRGVFARIGWLEEAMTWIRDQLGSSAALNDDVEQHNASGSFALIRFGTKGGHSYWFKATGEPNLHERQLTMHLAEMCRESLPRLIATREDWNAWLTEHAGQPIDLRFDDARWPEVSDSMARLQVASVGHTERLIALGAADQRPWVLRRHIGEIVAYLEESMGMQTSTKAPKLTSRRLQELGRILGDGCRAMEELSIPNAVVHNDLNADNILVHSEGCVFIDWSEAAVSNPFIMFEHMRLLVSSQSGTNSALLSATEMYRSRWLSYLDARTVDLGMAIAPLLAPFSYLYGRGDWLHSAHRQEPRRRSFARSLARYIDRAAQRPLVLEALCRY